MTGVWCQQKHVHSFVGKSPLKVRLFIRMYVPFSSLFIRMYVPSPSLVAVLFFTLFKGSNFAKI